MYNTFRMSALIRSNFANWTKVLCSVPFVLQIPFISKVSQVRVLPQTTGEVVSNICDKVIFFCCSCYFILGTLSSFQSFILVWLFATPWIAARQVYPSITNSRSLLKLMSTELVMLSSHLMLCCALLLLPPIPPSIKVFSNESTFRMRWPKYWSFSFIISPSDEHRGLTSFLGWTGWISLQSKGLSRVFSNTTVQKHEFFSAQPSLQSSSHIHPWPLEKP